MEVYFRHDFEEGSSGANLVADVDGAVVEAEVASFEVMPGSEAALASARGRSDDGAAADRFRARPAPEAEAETSGSVPLPYTVVRFDVVLPGGPDGASPAPDAVRRRVEAELLARHGLEQADIATAEAQAALERIAEDRVREVAQIARIGRDAAAALAASASTPQPEDRPKVSAKPAPSRRHPLAAWLHEARRADRIAARDDDDHWPRRGQTEVRPADRKFEAAPSRRPRITPREPGR